MQVCSVSVFALVLLAHFINRKVNEMTWFETIDCGPACCWSYKLKCRMIKAIVSIMRRKLFNPWSVSPVRSESISAEIDFTRSVTPKCVLVFVTFCVSRHLLINLMFPVLDEILTLTVLCSNNSIKHTLKSQDTHFKVFEFEIRRWWTLLPNNTICNGKERTSAEKIRKWQLRPPVKHLS